METIELYRIIESKDRKINYLNKQNKDLIIKNKELQEQLRIYVVGQSQTEKFCGCDWWGDGKSEIHLNTYTVCKHCDKKL